MSTTDASAVVRTRYESPPLSESDIADVGANLRDTYARDTVAGVCVVDGMGLGLSVNRGALVVEDGIGPHRRTRRFDKATHGLRRLVVIGSTGHVTLDALTWCRRLGIGFVVVGPDGVASLASTPRMTDDARLRRVQAQAPDLPVGIDLARDLITDKLVGQAKVLSGYFSAHDEASTVADLVEALSSARTAEDVRGIEAAAASVYWQAWAGRPESRAALRHQGPFSDPCPLDPVRGQAIGAEVGEPEPQSGTTTQRHLELPVRTGRRRSRPRLPGGRA